MKDIYTMCPSTCMSRLAIGIPYTWWYNFVHDPTLLVTQHCEWRVTHSYSAINVYCTVSDIYEIPHAVYEKPLFMGYCYVEGVGMNIWIDVFVCAGVLQLGEQWNNHSFLFYVHSLCNVIHSALHGELLRRLMSSYESCIVWYALQYLYRYF